MDSIAGSITERFTRFHGQGMNYVAGLLLLVSENEVPINMCFRCTKNGVFFLAAIGNTIDDDVGPVIF